ncbi:hypothetical protein GCM10023116_22480 [Kistimonas scapharcae]|uniref:Uncharacterized protein n=1 Tax=Kistimonas scapharcae TaxID=1036133 RepID=A0ABP8V1K5_9GAMM
MAASAQSRTTSQSYSPVNTIPPVFDRTTSLRTVDANRLVKADGNLTPEAQQYFTADPIAIDERSARPCNPDVLFPKAVPVVQPLLGILSWFICTFERVARFARDQLGLTPSRPGHLVFEAFELPNTLVKPSEFRNNQQITLDEFKQQALPELPADSGYFLDRPSSDWAGITNADVRTVMDQCQRNPAQAKFVKNMYESIPDPRPEDEDKIAIPNKAEMHVAGRVASHGIRGHADIQTQTQEALKKIREENTPYLNSRLTI